MPEHFERRDGRARAKRARVPARAELRRALLRTLGRAPGARVVALAFAMLALAGAPAAAGPGTGNAIIVPTSPVQAGSLGIWTVQYSPTENFPISGGMIEIAIPTGWTLPQKTSPTSAGYVNWTDVDRVDSLTISGQTIRVYLGAADSLTDWDHRFMIGDAVSVLYGVGGGPASARAQTSAPATAVFEVRSDPELTGSPAPIASSPTLSVVPGPVVSVRVVDATLTAVGDLSRTTDQDTTHLYLRGYDSYGNSARFVDGNWTVTGGIGSPAPASGVGTVLGLTTPGTGYAVGDSGAWSDSTGIITVTRGAYGRLALTAAASATAGAPFAVAATATDADGNTITSGAGSAASVTFFAYADSVGSALADPDLVAAGATLSGGTYSGTLTARRAGAFHFAVTDSSAGFISPRRKVVVSPATPDHMVLSPDTLRLTAGEPDTAAVRVLDVYGNASPLAASRVLTLWTDRPAGGFQDLAGTTVYEITVPAGADSARFRFRDTQATGSPGRVRAIDADGASPFLGTASAWVVTSPAAPSGAVALTATPDTLVANGADSSLAVSGVARDVYGNAVAPGERFTLTGALVSPITDQDPGAVGAQLLADSSGVVRGFVRSGTVRGAGSATVVSERGSATGTASIRLLSGAPSGAIALSALPDSLAADSVATRDVTTSGLHDANGNQVEDGEAYTVTTTLGAIQAVDADAATPGVQVLASGGAVSFTLFGGDSLGTAQVAATAVRGSSAGSVNVRLVPGVVSAARSLVTAASPATVGATGSAIAVTLRDSQDHPLAGVPADSVSVQVVGAAAAVTPLAVSTDAAGRIDFRATATAADTGAVRAVARGVTLAAEPQVIFMPGPLDHYAIAGPAGPLSAGVGITLAVTAHDSFGNTLSGRSGDVLRPTVVAGGATVPDSVLLSGGAASVPVLPTLASPLTVSVSDDSSRAVTYGPVAVDPGAPYRAAASPAASDTLAAGDSLAIRARVTDLYGNATPGTSVQGSLVLGSGSVAPSSDDTDASGFADFVVHAGGALGALHVRVLAPASGAPDSIRADSLFFTVVPGGAVSADVAAPASGAAGDSLAITITLRDSFGNRAVAATPALWIRTSTAAPVPDHVTWLPGPGAQGSLADSAGSDGARYVFAVGDSGAATLLLRDTLVETIRARASGPGVTLAQSSEIAIAAGAPSSIAILSGDGQTAVVAQELAQPLRVRVRDAFGNAAPGAGVLFRVESGGGALDVVRGGAADSIAAADGAGVAVCEVARLGTTAGSATDRFGASLLAAPSASVTFTASATPDTAASVAIAPASLSLGPTQASTVTVTARDRFGNPAPAAPVTVYLGSPIRGSLETLGATSGGPGSQGGVTDASGQLAVRYRAPSAAPATDSIFARGSSVGPAGILASTAPGSTAGLRVTADSLSWTAGNSERVLVQAVDAFGNIVLSDVATVTMRPAGSVIWSPASGALVAGEFVTFGRDTVAESVPLGADRAGGGGGSGGTAAVSPAAPSGAIAIAAARDSLTADGRSSTTVTLGPVRDAYGNLAAPGTLVGVGVQAGTLLASDASALYPGLDLATGTDGTASALLVAPATAGPDTLSAATRAGSATGVHAFTYVPPPSLAYVAGSLSPGAVLPNGSASFTLGLRNTGSGTIRIETPSVLSLGAGASVFAATVASAVTLGPGTTAALSLATATVPASLAPGVYAPSFRAIGTDGTGAGFDFYPSLAGAQVTVLGIAVTAVSASPDPAPLGYATLALIFDVANPAGIAASVTGLSLSYSTGAFVPNGGPTPALPATVPAGGVTRFTLPVRVPASGIASGTAVEARLHATADFAGTAVVDSNAAPLGFTVVSAARIASIPGTGAPQRFLRARTMGPGVRVGNSGSSTVTLARGTTRLVLDRGAATLAAALSANAVVAASDQATLAFDSLAIPASTPKGRYRARLLLDGTESGQAFADTIAFSPDSLDVLDPALLSVLAGSLDPDTVSAGQARPLSLSLRNAGDVPFALDAGTALRLGPPLGVLRALGAPATIAAGQTLPLAFGGGPLGSAGSPGAAAATLEVSGSEDGMPRGESLPAGTLLAEPPASLAFVARSTAPRDTRPGATVDLTLDVRNGGGSAFLIDPNASRLTVSDGVDAMVALASGAALTLAPGGQASLSFPGALVPAAMASQPYRVDLKLYGTEWGMADSVGVVSPDSEFVVLQPLGAIQVRGVDAAAPVQVSPGAGGVRAWGLELTPLTPPGGATRDSLQALAVTVLADGSAGAAPASVLGSIALRDRAGALLAQATPSPGASNPVTLALATPLVMTGAAESLYIEISLIPGGPGSASRVALRLAQSTDVLAVDALTQVRVPVVGGGGLPFAPLTSPEITLFERAHGYPNPFRAGRDAVLLSYVLRQDSPVRVAIYTLLGDLVREISIPAGSAGGASGLNEVPWDGRNGAGDLVRPGVYVARIEGSGLSEQIKVGVLR